MTRILALSLIVALLVGCINVSAVNLRLDVAQDRTNVVDISCAYSDDYFDFWVYGCPRTPSEDIFPESMGFWTACQRSCDIIYYGGLLPKPAKLIIKSYIEGDSNVQVSGKTRPDDPEFVFEYGELDAQPGWSTQEIDLSNFPGSDAAVIKFTIGNSSTGFVLIDSVEIDLGESPIEPIPLDTLSDELYTHWSYDDCYFVDDYKDFWVYGCPTETDSNNPVQGAVGYWSPCTRSSCTIEYLTSPSIIPTSVHVRGYVSGDAEILVTSPGTATVNNSRPAPIILKRIKTIYRAGVWIDEDFDLEEFNQFKIDIELIPKNGHAILDSLLFKFVASTTDPTLPTDLTDTTSATVPSVSPTDPTPTVSTSTESGASLVTSFLFTILLALVITIMQYN